MSQLEWTAGGAPRSAAFGDIYFNELDGAAEADYVFVAGNQLPERFAALPANGHFTIAELGFGTGLNLLCAWRCFERYAPPSAQLTFMSTEAAPLQRAELARAHCAFPALASYSERLVAALPPPLAGLYAVELSPRVRLLLWLGDAGAGLSEWLPQVGPVSSSRLSYQGWVDAWFFDGFAPAKNPAMWTPELLASAGRLCRPGATCSTFTSAGAVRRGLITAGFTVSKIKGYGTKREMTVGWHPGGQLVAGAPSGSWWRPAAAAAAGPVAVVGAGLAGCHTAAALAASGREVVVFEAAQIAAGASGNQRALLYSKFSHRGGPVADFNLVAYCFAESFYRSRGWRGAGILHRPGAQTALELAAIAERLGEPQLAAWLPDAAASACAGVELPTGALWLPQGGALDPGGFCRQLLEQARVTVFEHCPITELTPSAGGWRLGGGAAAGSMEFAAVVLCNAHAAGATRFTEALPLGAQRGQVTLAELAQTPAVALCGEGYVIPTGTGRAWLGATYDKDDFDLRPRAQDDAANLERAAQLGAGAVLTARAGVRATLPDYLPCVGPVADAERFAAAFAAWRHNAKRAVDALCPTWPGLYINCGHGSRGAAYTPLAAALISAYIGDRPLPLDTKLAAALSPARFLKRALARAKTE